MTKSVIPHNDSKSKRVDPPHAPMTMSTEASRAETSASPWMAYAGRDPESLSEQVDSQANELLSYVQDQDKDIDERQAELNAKLARLDSQLRSARLQGVDEVGTDLLADQPSIRPAQELHEKDDPMPDVGSDNAPTIDKRDSGQLPDRARINRLAAPQTPQSINQEFEEVDRIVAQFSDLQLDRTPPPSGPSSDESTGDSTGRRTADPVPSDVLPHATETANESFMADATDAFPSLLAQSHWGRLDGEPRSDADILASERRQLAERQLELDREKSVVGRLQEEARTLYREALEMRLVTEQLWRKLSELTPEAKVQEHIADLRARLETHYAAEHTAIASRRDELMTLQRTLEVKQAALREQSARMQEWFTTRDEQLRSYSNEIDVRCSLLDRRELRLQDELAKWQAQRKGYENQLQGLAQKLKLSGVSLS